MQTAMVSAAVALPRADAFARPAPPGRRAGLGPYVRAKAARPGLAVRAANNQDPLQVVQPINGDPYIGMLETPVTSSPLVAGFLSNLPAYRTGVDPLLRGVEVGLAHGYFLPGPFIKLGPLRNVPEIAERSGSISAAGLVLILTVALTIYGAVQFNSPPGPQLGVKTLSGREVQRDSLQSSGGWTKFTAGWLVGGLSGVAWCYILTQTLPYYR